MTERQTHQSGIDLYTWATPNGRKVSIMLEEIGLPYQVFPINVLEGDQLKPDFLKISPNNKIPAIVDHETGLELMESGAILMYLAQKAGKFMHQVQDGEAYWRELEWLMLQMGGVGPMFGQTHHFVKFNPGKSRYAEERYTAETQRLYGVLERRLEQERYLAGDYSVADIATWPWVSRFEFQQIDLHQYPAVKRWYLEIAARPAVRKGYAVPSALDIPLP